MRRLFSRRCIRVGLHLFRLRSSLPFSHADGLAVSRVRRFAYVSVSPAAGFRGCMGSKSRAPCPSALRCDSRGAACGALCQKRQSAAHENGKHPDLRCLRRPIGLRRGSKSIELQPPMPEPSRSGIGGFCRLGTCPRPTGVGATPSMRQIREFLPKNRSPFPAKGAAIVFF